MVKVSVIIPVYNTEKYLRECLDSVINQTLQDIEIICVNDGSTDGSLNILEEYAEKDKRIKIIEQKNKGVSSARNAGIDVASGNFIGFLDSDDYIDLNFYKNLYNRGVETNSDIVVCEYMYRMKDNSQKKKIFLRVDKDIVTNSTKEKFESLYLPYFCHVWNKIYKRDSLQERFIDGQKWEDIYFTTNVLANSNRLSVAEDTAYYYRENPCSIVNTKTNLNHYYCYSAHAYFFKFLCDRHIDIDTNKYYSTKRYRFLGITFFKIIKNCFTKQYYLLKFIKWENTK